MDTLIKLKDGRWVHKDRIIDIYLDQGRTTVRYDTGAESTKSVEVQGVTVDQMAERINAEAAKP